jgi:hypothetical protein
MDAVRAKLKQTFSSINLICALSGEEDRVTLV